MNEHASDTLRRAAAQARAEAETHRAVAPHLIGLYGDDCGSECQAARDLAVADWLERVATQHETLTTAMHLRRNRPRRWWHRAPGGPTSPIAIDNVTSMKHALAVAHAFLGESS